MTLKVRIRFTKSLLRHSQRLSFAFGFCCLGLSALLLAQVWVFQAYQDWAFEQKIQGEPVSLSRFLAQAAPLAELPAAPVLAVETHPASFPAVSPSVLGRIEIPRIGLKAVILEGATRHTLALAVGHIPGTALPGAKGNAALAGHRDTFFRGLSGIRAGDTILVTMLEGSFKYRVQSLRVVAPRDISVLDNTAEPVLTLVTCYPFRYLGPAPQRFIVRATRVAG